MNVFITFWSSVVFLAIWILQCLTIGGSPDNDTDTVAQNSQESRCKYWATCSSIRSFARTAHLFACSAQLALLTRTAALTHSLILLTPELVGE